MKKSLLLILCFIAFKANATHLLNSQIAVKYIGNGVGNDRYYQISVTIFRDCLNGQADFDDSLRLGIYNLSNDSLIRYEDFQIQNKQFIGSGQQNLCFEKASYVKTITVNKNFYITTSRCCRAAILNVKDDLGSSVYTEVSTSIINNEIKFPVYNLPIVVGTGKNQSFDISSPDTSADSSIYELKTSIQGGDVFDPRPYPKSKPYAPNIYSAGYSISNPLGTANSISLDRNTGILSLTVNMIGAYAVGVVVTQYKNGIVRYRQIRDLSIYSCLNCFSLSVAKTESAIPGLTISPNPASFNITISSNNLQSNEPIDVTIYNNEGKMVKQITIESGDNISVNDLANGIYFIEMQSKDKRSYSKFNKI